MRTDPRRVRLWVAAVLAAVSLSVGCAERGGGCASLDNREAPFEAERMGEAVKNVAEENATVIGQISQLLFEGEHLPTRQDHVNDTVIVFAKNGSATGKTTKAIDEPNGEQRQQGTKDFTFTGSYDAKTGVLSGTYTITVKYTIAGGGMPQKVEHEYTASGTLKMTKGADGVFKGTAEGDYTLDEVYSGGDSNPAPKKESGDLTWMATAVPQ